MNIINKKMTKRVLFQLGLFLILAFNYISCKEDDNRIYKNTYSTIIPPNLSWSVIGKKDSVVRVRVQLKDSGSRNLVKLELEYYEDSLFISNKKSIILSSFSNNILYLDITGLNSSKGYWARVVVTTDLDSFHFTPKLLSNVDTKFNELFAQNLILYYPFNGNTQDESGENNHGSGYNLSLVSDRSNFPSSAYYFDGSSSYINIPKFNNLPYYPITISFWANFNYLCSSGSECFQVIIGRDAWGNTSQGNIVLHSASNNSIQNKLLYWTGGTADVSSISPITSNWQHYVFSYNNSQTKWYVNGVLTWSNNSTYNSNADIPFNIGCGGNRFYYNGKLDDIAIWNRVLSDKEVMDVYTYK
jgi:hypothetical protein